MTLLRSFPPQAAPDARVLILGSMPGEASLRAQRYYAHPRNLFWPIMGELVGAGPGLPYPERIARLNAAGIALWDVLLNCVRPGSLDARIDDASIVPNDFATFFADHPRISKVFFNGAKAEQTFVKRVLPGLPPGPVRDYRRLPSTSPANAGFSYAQRLEAWRAIVEP